jgi:hypothetical protein
MHDLDDVRKTDTILSGKRKYITVIFESEKWVLQIWNHGYINLAIKK